MFTPVGVPSLDDLLGGGVEHGCLSLTYGEAGSGKTNLCLQVGRNVARSGKKAIYIDTEGLSTERLRQICGSDFHEVVRSFLIFEPYDFVQQEECIEKAVKLIENTEEIGVLILDSATTHYRLTKADFEKDERRSLTRQVNALVRVARTKELPVVLTSQVYTDVEKGTFEPLGGHMLSHNAKMILRLERAGPNRRLATLMKHRHRPEHGSVLFRIAEAGIVGEEGVSG